MKKLKSHSPAFSQQVKAHGGVSNTNQIKPAFSLEHIQRNFCLTDCETDEKAAFADALLKRSRMTWQEIIQAPKHGLGVEKIKRQCIRAPVPEIIPEDVDHFLALRFNGKAPMVGYRNQTIFYVLWIDRAFSLYEH